MSNFHVSPDKYCIGGSIREEQAVFPHGYSEANAKFNLERSFKWCATCPQKIFRFDTHGQCPQCRLTTNPVTPCLRVYLSAIRKTMCNQCLFMTPAELKAIMAMETMHEIEETWRCRPYPPTGIP